MNKLIETVKCLLNDKSHPLDFDANEYRLKLIEGLVEAEREFINSVTQSTVKGKYDAFVAAGKTVTLDSSVGTLFLDGPTKERISGVVQVMFEAVSFPAEDVREKHFVQIHLPTYLSKALSSSFQEVRFGRTDIANGLYGKHFQFIPGAISQALNSYFEHVNVVSIIYVK